MTAVTEVAGRTCCDCGEWKAAEHFYVVARSGRLFSYCKPCSRERQKSQDKKRDPEALWRWHLQRTYGIDEQVYGEILLHQGGGCALCLKSAFDDNGDLIQPRFPVDHEHATGKIRGILCHSCNSALGKLGDNEHGLDRALRYVKGEL